MEGPGARLIAEELRIFTGSRVKFQLGTDPPETDLLRDVYVQGKRVYLHLGDRIISVFFGMYGRITQEPYPDGRRFSLKLSGENSVFYFWRCSIKFMEFSEFIKIFNPVIDILSPDFSVEVAAKAISDMTRLDQMVCDILLDQTIFSGAGNIIKNEALNCAGILPVRRCGSLSSTERVKLVSCVRNFSVQFLNMRRNGVRLSYYGNVYYKGKCGKCGGKVKKSKCGTTNRITFWCPVCQK